MNFNHPTFHFKAGQVVRDMWGERSRVVLLLQCIDHSKRKWIVMTRSGILTNYHFDDLWEDFDESLQKPSSG